MAQLFGKAPTGQNEETEVTGKCFPKNLECLFVYFFFLPEEGGEVSEGGNVGVWQHHYFLGL